MYSALTLELAVASGATGVWGFEGPPPSASFFSFGNKFLKLPLQFFLFLLRWA